MTAQTLEAPMPVAQTEQWIASHGASFELRTIRLAGINRSRSLTNQARFKALDEDTVMVYSAAMERGDKFPPIVVYKEPNGSFVVIDGNHRVAAAELVLGNEIDAYVIEGVSELQVQTMTFEANAKHGLPSSIEERIQHGLYLVDLGVSHRDAATMVNVPLNTLQREVERHRADGRFSASNIERWNAIAVGGRQRMNAIRNDVVFQAAAKLVVEAGLNTTDISTMVTSINKVTTEADQLAVVDSYRQRHASTISLTAGGRVPTPVSMMRLSRALAYAEGVEVKELERVKSAMTPEQLKALNSRLSRGAVILMEAKRALDPGV